MTKAKVNIDLADLSTTDACNKGFEFEIVHPVSKEGTGAFITVVGMDSDVCKDHQSDLTNRKIREAAARAQAGKDTPVLTVEDRKREGTELLVACTMGFRNVTYKGSELQFSPSAAFTLYENLDFVRRQVDAAISDISNFMPVQLKT